MVIRKSFVVAGTVIAAGVAGSLQDRASWEGYCEPRPVALCPGSLRAVPQTGGGQQPNLWPTAEMVTATASLSTNWIKRL